MMQLSFMVENCNKQFDKFNEKQQNILHFNLKKCKKHKNVNKLSNFRLNYLKLKKFSVSRNYKRDADRMELRLQK